MNIATMNAGVPAAIKRIINERGLKQRVIAEQCGMTPLAFSDMLNGRKLIKVSDLVTIAGVLGVCPNDLFDQHNHSA